MQQQQQQKSEFDEQAIREGLGDISVDNISDFSMNPDLYLHVCIANVLKALPRGVERGKIEDGFTLMIVAVDQLEQLCVSRKLVNKENYLDLIDAEKNRLMADGLDAAIFSQRLANFRFGLLTKLIFSKQPDYKPLLM